MKMHKSKVVLSKKALFNFIATSTVGAILQHQAQAVEIEPMGKALVAILGTHQVVKKNVEVSGQQVPVFYVKGAGKNVAFIQKGIFEPNCTHTWAVGIEKATGKVSEVRVIEMSCPHAFPTKAASFLDQYKGKGPADLAKLDSEAETIAKATGSCKLATDAVKRSITAYSKLKGQI